MDHFITAYSDGATMDEKKRARSSMKTSNFNKLNEDNDQTERRRASTITGHVALTGFHEKNTDKHAFAVNYWILFRYFWYHQLWPFITPLQVWYEGQKTTTTTLLNVNSLDAWKINHLTGTGFWVLMALSWTHEFGFPDAALAVKSASVGIALTVWMTKALRDLVIALKYACYTEDDWEYLQTEGPQEGFLYERLLIQWADPARSCIIREGRLAAFRAASPIDCQDFYFTYCAQREAALRRMIYTDDVKEELEDLCAGIQMKDGRLPGLLAVYSAFLQATHDNLRVYSRPVVIGWRLGIFYTLLPMCLDVAVGNFSKYWGSNVNIWSGETEDGETVPVASSIIMVILWVCLYINFHGAVLAYLFTAIHDYRRRSIMLQFFTALIAPRRSKYPRQTNGDYHEQGAHRIPEVQEVPPALVLSDHNLINWLRARHMAKTMGEQFHARSQIVIGAAFIYNIAIVVRMAVELFLGVESVLINDTSLGLASLIFGDMFFIFYVISLCVLNGDDANQQAHFSVVALKRHILENELLEVHHKQKQYVMTQETVDNVVSWLELSSHHFPVKIFGFRADNNLFKSIATLGASAAGLLSRAISSL